MSTTDTAERRIYVACLASYNAGILHGRWIDATDDADDMQEHVAEMLRESPCPNVEVEHPETGELVPSAEEWAIHDYDGLPASLGECASLETIAAYVERLEQFEEAGIPADVVAQLDDEVEPEAFRGVADSLEDYVADFYEETGELQNVPESLRNYIDWKAVARDWQLGGDVTVIRGADYRAYIFSNY